MKQSDSCRKGGVREGWLKEGEEFRQRTYIHDPWT